MTQPQLSSRTFQRPEAFDAAQYLKQPLPFLQSKYHIDLWIDMPFEQAKSSFELWRVAMEEEDGGVRLLCGRDNLGFFAATLLSLGRRIIVHQPMELRDTFRILAERAMQAADATTVISPNGPNR